MPLTRRQFLGRAALGLGALGALTGGGLVGQAYAFQVSRPRATLAGLRAPLRVAVLADLHYGPWIAAGQLARWVDATLSARPDLILLPGDFVDLNLSLRPDALLAQLARPRAPLGVWGSWGNHDYGSFGLYASRLTRAPARADWPQVRAQFTAWLAQAGVHILTNRSVRLRPDLALAAVDDLWWGEPDLERALSGLQGTPTLLMSHNPDLLPQVPGWVGLTVSGHTHGGQVRLPLLGAPVVPSRFGQRFAQGFVTGDLGARGFVSRGLGVSGLPVRNLCPPEVVILELEG